MQIPEIAKLANEAKFGSKAKSLNNLRELGTACLKYESKHRRYPANIRDKTGKPMLSWRVAILPYFGEKELYKQFHLDERGIAITMASCWPKCRKYILASTKY